MSEGTGARGPARRWRLRTLGLLLWVVAASLLAPHLRSGTEHVRIRNALLLDADWREADDWTPPARPMGYRYESVPVDPRFAQVAQRLGLEALPDDWARAQAIGRHLLTGAPRLGGGAIQADLWTTYLRIVQRGDGYCGDFVRVFQALANVSGLIVRPWAFSFDGFGGHGHIWVELWNAQRGRWQLIDIFDNFYFVRAGENEPMAALALRRALAAAGPSGVHGLELRRLVPEARPGYEIDAKAWEYFQRGAQQWYLPFGNNVMSVDAAPAVRLFSGWRAGEGVGALLSGRLPVVRLLVSEDNAAQREDLRRTRARVLGALAAGALGTLAFLLAPWLAPLRARRRPAVEATLTAAEGWPRLCVVGPLPPPSGGMANQCEQLLRLLRGEGAHVVLVRTNPPYRPAIVGRVQGLRAVFRLVPYVWSLWRAVGTADVVHVFANSGWAWHLFAWPALLVARVRGVPVIVNYRGGQADEFLRRAPRWVLGALRGAALRVTPSPFLRRVFAKHGLRAEIIPNVIDMQRFQPRPPRAVGDDPHVIVTRNLEPIYDIPTALRAFARIRAQRPGARLTVAGSGPERQALEALAVELGLAGSVRFSGRIDNARIGELYASADLLLNPSQVDNMPISILEALASAVPVVSTNAGGIPDLVEDGRTALLVPVGDADAMGAAALRLFDDPALAAGLCASGLREVARYAWPQVRSAWREAYLSVLTPPPAALVAER